jgi:hypothetical protein
MRQAGHGELQRSIARLTLWLSDRTSSLRDWQDSSLLSVEVSHVQQWYRPGSLAANELLVGHRADARVERPCSRGGWPRAGACLRLSKPIDGCRGNGHCESKPRDDAWH